MEEGAQKILVEQNISRLKEAGVDRDAPDDEEERDIEAEQARQVRCASTNRWHVPTHKVVITYFKWIDSKEKADQL